MNITYKRNLNMNANEIKKHDGEEELLSVVKVDDEHMSWEEVDKEYTDNVEAAINLQRDLVKVFTENEKAINEDKELYSIAAGILKTIGDVVKEYKDTRDIYFDDIGKEINKDEDEDVVKYLTVQQDFVATSEKFANVTLIAVTDVMTRLNKINDLGMEQQIAELNELKESTDGK